MHNTISVDSGGVVDYKKKPVEAAIISLMKAADSSVFKISVTDKAGNFLSKTFLLEIIMQMHPQSTM